MNVFIWILQGVLALVYLTAGSLKLLRPRAKLKESGLEWVEDFSDGTVKIIGVLEILAAIGLILPGVTGIAPILVPLAAVGLILLMVGAAITHARRKETPMIVSNVVLLILAGIVAWARFGPYPL